MEKEYFEIDKAFIEKLNRKTSRSPAFSGESAGRRIAVGTTTCRALETVYYKGSRLKAQGSREKPSTFSLEPRAYSCWTDLFIYPPYKFKAIDALLTNFHLPGTTLLMLVSAFCGRELLFKAYKEAIEKKYRFYSYGDAMLII